MGPVQWFSVAGSVVVGAMVVFQLLLAAGLPLGAAAWGGQHRVLPSELRILSLFSAVILGVAGWVLLARADLVAPGPDVVWVRVSAWVFAGFLTLNTLGNLASKSRVERNIMTPAAALLVAWFVIVASS